MSRVDGSANSRKMTLDRLVHKVKTKFKRYFPTMQIIRNSDYFLIPSRLRRKPSFLDAFLRGERVYDWIQQSIAIDSDWSVLDVGCGDGCVAGAFARHSHRGLYTGFDINPVWINEMNSLYSRKGLNNFAFKYADMFHSYYNRKGSVDPISYAFPVDDSSIILVIFNSIFTHMKMELIRHYLDESRRILKPGGKIWCTFFVLDEHYNEDSVNDLHKKREVYDEGWTGTPEKPELILMFPRESVWRAIEGAGFKVVNFKQGAWKTAARSRLDPRQDILLLEAV